MHRRDQQTTILQRTAAVATSLCLMGSVGAIPTRAAAQVTTLTCTQPTSGTVICQLPNVEGTIYVELQEVMAAAQALNGAIGETTPMIITAWGGHGGHGWDQNSLVHYGSGGAGGVAQTQTTLSDYALTYGTPVLFYFLGLPGTDAIPDDTVYGGLGATSTIAGPGNLYSDDACISGYSSDCTPNVLVLAGGGGGGGQAGDSDSGGDGGRGGDATASATGAATGGGAAGNDGDGDGGHGGAGGNDGEHGDGGDGGIGIDSHSGGSGNDGIGGVGGPVHYADGSTPTEEWSNAGLLTPIGTDGAGGEGQYRGTPPDVGAGGGGGGGFGGGGGGGGGGNTESGGGGGGGGSYAAQATAQASPPAQTQDGTNGEVTVAFVVQAQQLVFVTQPDNIVAGDTTDAPTVQLQDQSGADVAQSGVLVTLSLVKGSTVTLQQAETDGAGLATFDGFTLETVGGYHLSASAPNADPAISDVFVVSPASGWQLAFVQNPSDVAAAQAMSPAVTVQLQDSSGAALAASQVPVELLLDPTGTFVTDTNVSETDATGLATFSDVAITSAGTFTMRALAPDASSAASPAFTVSPESADGLVFVVPPSDVIVGGVISPTMQLQVADAYGNAVASQGLRICLAAAPSASLAGSCADTDSDGIASYDAFTIQPVGTYTLTASGNDGDGAALQEATSSSFGVSAGTASGLAWVETPGEVTAGRAFSPTVHVVNQFGVAYAAQFVTVELHVDSLDSTIVRRAITDASGTAQFQDVRLFNAGEAQLIATADGLESTGATVLVLAGEVPIRLAFTQQPSDAVVGETVSPPVVVQLESLFGNDTTGECDSCEDVYTIQLVNEDGTEIARQDADVFGAATFSDLVFDTPGTYRLTASRVLDNSGESPLIPARSRSFVISAAASPTPTPVGSATATPTSGSPTATPSGTPAACPGDCNGDGMVTVNELVTMVNISLGTDPLSACSAGDLDGDGEITVDELIRAVNAAVAGCAA